MMKNKDNPTTEQGHSISMLLAAGAPNPKLSTDAIALDGAVVSRGNGIGATSEDCPSNEFSEGNPNGKCWGDGHYRCKNCKNFREDFKRLGQDFIDFAHQIQSTVQIQNVKII